MPPKEASGFRTRKPLFLPALPVGAAAAAAATAPPPLQFFQAPCTPCEGSLPTLPTKLLANLFVGGYTPQLELHGCFKTAIVYGFNCTGQKSRDIKNITYADDAACYDIAFGLIAASQEGDKKRVFAPFNKLIDAICQRVRAGETVYIHCFAGQDRAPLVAAACLVELKAAQSIGDAIAQLDIALKRKHSLKGNQTVLDEWLAWRNRPAIILEHSSLGCFF